MKRPQIQLINLPEDIASVLITLLQEEMLGECQRFHCNNVIEFLNSNRSTQDYVIVYDPQVDESSLSLLNIDNSGPTALITEDVTFEMERSARAKHISTIIKADDPELVTLLYGFIQQHRIYQNQRALVVDDSRVDSTVVSNILTKEFIHNQINLDPNDVIATLEANANITLVILDYDMPGKDGCSVMREIKSTFKDRDFIFIGLTGSRNGAIKFLSHGADDVFIKPLDHEMFSVTLRKLIFNFHQASLKKQALSDYKSIVKAITKGIYDPIYAILTVNDCLLENKQNQADLRSIKEVSRTSKEKLSRTFDDLLSYLEVTSHIHTFASKPCSLNSMIASQLYLESSRAKLRNILINQSIDKKVKHMMVPREIEQVINHLTHNALMHSSADSEVNIRLFQNDNHIVFEIEDTSAVNNSSEFASPNVKPIKAKPLPAENILDLGYCQKVLSEHGGKLGIKQNHKGNVYFFELPVTAATTRDLH